MTDNAFQLAQSALSSIQALQTQVAVLSGQIHAQGGTVTPQGQAITTITNTITSEASARASADDALATRVGAFSCNLDSCRPIPEDAAASATSFLTARVTSAEESTLAVDPGQAVEPLRLGKVTFYGESARVIRDAQAVLQAAGAGQLEVVKRANESGEPFVVIEGQVFISEAVVGKAKVSAFAGDYSQSSVKLALDGEGRYYVAGVDLGVDHLVTPELRLGAGLEEDVRRLLRAEMKPGGILNPV